MDLRSHGYLFAISSDRTPRETARGCGQVRWVSHQQGGNRSEEWPRNGFTGLIGVFGNKRHKSPRVTGMAAGQGGNCRSSRGRNSAKTLMMAFVRSLRSDPMDHAIAPSLRSLSVITNSYRKSTLFCIWYLPGGHSGFSSGHRGDDRCKRIPIDVHRGRRRTVSATFYRFSTIFYRKLACDPSLTTL